jgi:hypothetical protein
LAFITLITGLYYRYKINKKPKYKIYEHSNNIRHKNEDFAEFMTGRTMDFPKKTKID